MLKIERYQMRGEKLMRRKSVGRFVTICETELLRKRGVTEVSCETGLTHFVIQLHEDDARAAQQRVQIVHALSKAGIRPMLVKFHPQALHFAVRSDERESALKTLNGLPLKSKPKVTDNCCLINVVSSAMRDLPGVMSRIAETALRLSVDVLEISDTRSSVLLLVRKEKAEALLSALREAFGIKHSQRIKRPSAVKG